MPQPVLIAGRMLYQLNYRELVSELGQLLGSCVTNVLYTAWISNVESVLCGHIARKMVNFELGY